MKKSLLGSVTKVTWGNTSITKASYRQSGHVAYSATGADGWLESFEHDEDGIVLSAIGARCGRCFYARDKWTAIKNTITITSNGGGVYLPFLFHFLNTKNLWPRNGGAQPFISLESARSLPVQLPPLDQQKRIAAILDKADAIRRKREQAIQLADEFLRSLFLEMFGDPVRNPKGWPVLSFRNVIRSIETGVSVGGQPRPPNPGEKAVLKISSVTWGTFDPFEAKAVDPARLPERLVTPRRGDLLFSRANTRELVAATCIVPSDFPDLFLPDKLWRLSLDEEVATPEYIHFVLSHDAFRKRFTRSATGTSGSMLNISQSKLLCYTLPVPPVKIQRNFCKAVEHLAQMTGQMRKSEKASKSLSSCLALTAFLW